MTPTANRPAKAPLTPLPASAAPPRPTQLRSTCGRPKNSQSWARGPPAASCWSAPPVSLPDQSLIPNDAPRSHPPSPSPPPRCNHPLPTQHCTRPTPSHRTKPTNQRHRQDLARARRRGRGGRPLLLHSGVRVCGAICGDGGDAGAGAVCKREEGGARDRVHRRD